jgi:hypothetical protein
MFEEPKKAWEYWRKKGRELEAEEKEFERKTMFILRDALTTCPPTLCYTAHRFKRLLFYSANLILILTKTKHDLST